MLTNEVIHKISEQVTDSDDIQAIIFSLKDNLTSTSVGIAAPQIGVLKRIIMCKINGIWIPMINPKWATTYMEKKQSEESCLSFPGKLVKKQRYYQIFVDYEDELKNPHIIKVTGLAAYIVQHECDHLDGVTI